MRKRELNPLLSHNQTPHNAYPFDRVKKTDFEPAFIEAFQSLEEEIEAITTQTSPPTFENSVVALERSGERLNEVRSLFFTLHSTEADDELMAMAQHFSPQLTAIQNKIYLNESLFQRIEAVYKERETISLTTEEQELLKTSYETFRRNGATLSSQEKAAYRHMSRELNRLKLTFDDHILKEQNAFTLLITNRDELLGIPATVCETAACAASERGENGWLFTLDAPSYLPFMQYAQNRSLRKKMYDARMKVANNNNKYDNKEIVRQIAHLRLSMAQLMGYKHYAAFALQDKMAKDEKQVYHLLEQLLEAYLPTAKKEVETLQTFADQIEEKKRTLKPWDWNYYAEKLKKERFALDDEMTRPYFELTHTTQQLFQLVKTLYGITLKVNKEIPVYHPEVTPYEVYDKDGSFLALLYTDFFPRKGKRAGAWMNDIKRQSIDREGHDRRPHIVIVMNFPRPTASTPSLLSFNEVTTLFHEFGHALHGIFSACHYATLSGTNVKHDFVELPSQMMENWMREEAFLQQIGSHHQTGEQMPATMRRQLIDAANFHVGYNGCRQISFALLDMAWHTMEQPYEGDLITFEQEAWKKAIILPHKADHLFSSHFSHIFSGGYAAGYYGYKWAEVLEADAFSRFQKSGIFNQEVASLFRTEVLSKGGTEPPEILYARFRGEKPSINPLLIRSGLKKEIKTVG